VGTQIRSIRETLNISSVKVLGQNFFYGIFSTDHQRKILSGLQIFGWAPFSELHVWILKKEAYLK
jgi:hypothetical protein